MLPSHFASAPQPMSSNYFGPDWTAKVTVPVKRVGERWEFFYGGDVAARGTPFACLEAR